MEVGQVKAEIMASVEGFKSGIKSAKDSLNTAIDSMKSKANEMNVAFENMDKSLELWSKQNKVAADSSKYHVKELENNKVKMTELSKQIEVTEKALSETEKQFGKNSTEYKKQENELLNLKIRYEDLIKETKKLEQSTTIWGIISHNMEKAGDKLKDFGSKASNLGKEMTTKVTAPIVAVGTAATKMGMDFEKGMTKVNTIAQVGKKDLEALSKSTLKLSDDTGVVAKDLAEMEYNALSASVSVKDLTGVVKQSAELSKGGFADANDSLKLLTSTYNVFRGEFEKANIDQVKASEMIADKMMTIQNLGVTTVGELSTQIGNVTSIAKNANMELDDLGASMIVLTKNGLGTSQSVTGLKAALSNIIKPSEQASKMAESLGLDFSTTAIKTKGFGGFLKDLREKLKSTSPALVEAADKVSKYQHMIDNASKSQKANKEQMRLWKSQLKDAKEQLKVLTKSGGETTGALAQLFGSVEGLGSVLTLTSEYGMKDFEKGLEASKNSLGSTKKAADMMAETTSEKFAKALNKLKNRGIELGLKLMPLAEKGIKYIEEFTDCLSKLNPKTQEFAIKTAIAAAAFGPFVGGTGKAISGIGSMIKLGGNVAKFFGLFKGAKVATGAVKGLGTAATVATGTASSGGIAGLAASFGPAIAAAAPWIAVAAGVSAAGYGIYKTLNKKTIPEVNLFADKVEYTSSTVGTAYGGMAGQVETNTIKISDATKKALGSYMKLDDKATKALMSLKFNSEKITEENSKNVIGTFNNMTTQITGTMDKKFQENYGKMEKFFSETSALTDKEEDEILKKKRENYEFQKKVVEDGNKEIQKIISNAANKHRELTDEEYRIINNIRKNMQVDAVKTLSQGEKEQMVIMERLKRNSGNITAQQAADVIKNSAKSRDKSIADAEKKYNEVVAWVKYERDVTGNLSKEKADKILKAAENEREGSINEARDMHFQVVQHAKEQCKEHIEQVDTETGEIMTRWQRAKQWFKDNPITRYFKKQEEKMDGYIREKQNANAPKPVMYKPGVGGTTSWQGYASGTDSATPGIHEIAEDGFEIVTDRQYRWFNGGEKVFNNAESKKLLSALFDNKGKSENIAKEALAQAKESVTVKPRVSVSDTVMKDRTARQLNWGANKKTEYEKFLDFVDKLNKEEIEKSKDYMKDDYENRVKFLDNRLRILKNENSIELQTEKSKIDAQIAYYQKLSRNTNNKNAKRNYANKIASLRQYQKSVLNTTKANQKAQINELERSKRALKEYYDDATDLLNKREKEVKKSLKIQQNVFNNTINEYNAAIKRLSIDTKDLNQNLDNQRAIVILQNHKIEELKNRYEELAKTFGYAAEETIKSKKALEDAKTELINMSNAVDDAKQKIIDAAKEADKKIADSINNMVDRVKNALKQRYEDELKAQENHINNELKNLDRWKDESIKRIETVYDSKIKAIDKQLKAEDKADQDAEELKKINGLKSAMEFEHNEFNKAEMKKELNNLLKEREKRLQKEQLEGQKEKLQEEKENELKSINNIYESNRKNLERQLEDYRAFYASRTRDAKLQAEAEKMIVDNNQKDILELLHSYEEAYEQAGQSLGERLVTGFKPKIEELKSMLTSVQASFEDARTSALNAMVTDVAIINSMQEPSTNSVTTTDNRKSIVNHNEFTFNSPKALTPSEIRRNTETTLRNLAFNI